MKEETKCEIEEGALEIEDISGDSTLEITEENGSALQALIEEASENGHAHGEDIELSDEIPPDTTQVGHRLETEARWYALHTFNGYEAVAEDNLKKVVEKYALQDRIKEIFIPTEDIVVEKKGKKVLVPQRTMPSYIFVKMIYGDDIWHTITRTRGITGFVGPKGRALPLSPKEVISLKLERKPNIDVKIAVGDMIQVIDGPLAGQIATVLSVDAENKKCTVSVTIFSGRATNVELSFTQIKKQ